MVMSNPRDGDAQTSVLVSTTQTGRLTIGQCVEALVVQYTRGSKEKVTDDIVLGRDAYQIAFELEQMAQLPAGSIEDLLPSDSDPTVGDLIRCGIAAYEAARPKPEWWYHYPLPG